MERVESKAKIKLGHQGLEPGQYQDRKDQKRPADVIGNAAHMQR